MESELTCGELDTLFISSSSKNLERVKDDFGGGFWWINGWWRLLDRAETSQGGRLGT